MSDISRLVVINFATTDLPTALGRLASALLVVVLGWGLLVAALASWRPTARWARALTPHALRGLVFTALSGSLAISPAHAGNDLDGLPLPQRGTTPHVSTEAARFAGDRHVVAAGESLWSISSRRLAPNVSPAALADESSAWYRANRDVIGPDPNLIQPGQVLQVPRSEDVR